MADEDTPTEEAPAEDPTEGHDPTSGADTSEPSTGTDGDQDSDDGEEGQELDAVEAEGASSPRTQVRMSEVNATLVGDLILHYPARNVSLLCDGDAAMRLLTMFRRRTSTGYDDRLSPQESANSGWIVVDLAENPPLAMSWLPRWPLRRPRTAIDPRMPR